MLLGSTLVTSDLDVCTILSPDAIARLREIFRDLHPRHRFTSQKISFLESRSGNAALHLYLELAECGDHLGAEVVVLPLHVGAGPRIADAIGFIGRRIQAPDWVERTVLEARERMDEQKRAIGMPVEAVDPRRIRGR